MAFVAIGFDHVVANMFFRPAAAAVRFGEGSAQAEVRRRELMRR